MDGLTGHELCARLEIDAKQLAAWSREGLPSSGRGKRKRFDPVAVRQWLLANNKAEPEPPTSTTTTPPAAPPREQPIATTIAQVAEYFEVSTRSVHTWINEGMPGKAGRPGTQEGQFPLFDIEDWRQGRKAPRVTTNEETKHQAQARLFTTRAEILELELHKARGNLADVAEVTRRWLRFTHEAKSQLLQLPAAIVKALPDDLPPKIRKRTRAAVRKQIDRVCETLELFLRTEAEEADNPTPPAEESADGSGID